MFEETVTDHEIVPTQSNDEQNVEQDENLVDVTPSPNATIPRIVDIFKEDQLFKGCFPIFLATQTQQIFAIKTDEDVTKEAPSKLLLKKDILADFQKRAAVSDFSVKKSGIIEYPGSELLLLYDADRKFDENFVIVLDEDTKNQILNPPVEDVLLKAPEIDEIEEESEDVNMISPTPRNTWICYGSHLEIMEETFTETRPKIVTIYQRKRCDFGFPLSFGNRNASTKGAYSEVLSYDDKSFDVAIKEFCKGVSNTQTMTERGCNTDWKYPRNNITQYYPRAFASDKIQMYLSPGGKLHEIGKLYKHFEQGLLQNMMVDFLFDDYLNLAAGDDTFETRADNTFKEFLSFTDLKYSKDKTVAHVVWHPTIKGIVAIAVVEHLNYDQRMDQFLRIIHTPSYIIFWSFFDPIKPQLLLEAPDDIICFQFNPTDPNIVAGGCVNGQIVLWDIEKHMNDLASVKEHLRAKEKTPLFGFDDFDPHKIAVSPFCALSSIEHSHSVPILDLQWVPDHFEVNRLGYTIENQSLRSVQLMTCAIDHEILFWDTRLDRTPLAIDKTRDILTMPRNVPTTFAGLDMKWKPLLRVHLFNKDGYDHSPTKFCMKERQGDRSVIKRLDEKATHTGAASGGTGTAVTGGGGGSGAGSKPRTLQGVNTFFYIGTEDGDLVHVDWMPHKDQESGKMVTPDPEFHAAQHDGPVTFLQRSPFDVNLFLLVGGWTWSLWKDGLHTGPLLEGCQAAKPLTGGAWSPSRPAVFYLTRADGSLEVWDLLDKTHEPSMVQSLSSVALSCVAIWHNPKRQLIAVGDEHGALHIFVVPQRLRRSAPTEKANMAAYITREVQRRSYVMNRWTIREQEKIEHEAELKRKAGLSVGAQLSDEDIATKQRSFESICKEKHGFDPVASPGDIRSLWANIHFDPFYELILGRLLKLEYDQFIESERTFLRNLGLVDD